MKRGYQRMKVGDFDAAISDFTDAIFLSPSYAKAFYCRGSAYHGKRDHAKAKLDFDRAQRLGYKLR